MDLPIKFPSDADVIREEVRLFRDLSPEEQVEAINRMFGEYQAKRIASGNVEEFDRLAAEEERLGREAIMEFVRRQDYTFQIIEN